MADHDPIIIADAGPLIYNSDAVQALEAIASLYTLKPIVSTVIETNSLSME